MGVVKEGTLAVDSGGGGITIDSMAGTFAEIQSRGVPTKYHSLPSVPLDCSIDLLFRSH